MPAAPASASDAEAPASVASVTRAFQGVPVDTGSGVLEGLVARRPLGVGRVEHAEQRRPRGEVDVELGVLLGGRAKPELVLVGVAAGKIVIVVAENVPEVDRERAVAGRIRIVVRPAADVGRGVDDAGNCVAAGTFR